LPTSLWALYIFAGPHSDVGKGGDSISIPSAQAWTPSILTEPHNSLNDALAPLDRTKPLHLLLCWQ
jgi:hypothetical protein